MPSFADRLHAAIRSKRTAAVVGLDPRWDQLPQSFRHSDSHAYRAVAYESFCREVIEIVAPVVPAVKPQSAFFEECGPLGAVALERVIRAARNAGLLVICDAKRGDIGTTAEAYAAAYLAGEDPDAAPFAADALTINPYMGLDTLQPFIDRAKAVRGGLYTLVRTSNPGARDFQDRETDGSSLFLHIARCVENLSHDLALEEGYGLLGAVVGATYPAELQQLRVEMPHVPLLVPGYGSQGGTSADVASAFDAEGLGAVVNNSRGILFGFRKGKLAEEFGESRWQDAVAAATRHMIADLRENTTCSRL